VISEKYATVIDALYSGASETEITSEIAYEDGQRGTTRAKVAIEDVHV
jgi:long-chain acyl-CoA synthetase